MEPAVVIHSRPNMGRTMTEKASIDSTGGGFGDLRWGASYVRSNLISIRLASEDCSHYLRSWISFLSIRTKLQRELQHFLIGGLLAAFS